MARPFRPVARHLEDAVKAVCPVFGVSVGTIGVAASVRLDFKPEATAQQQADAQAVVNAFDWTEAAEDTRTNVIQRGEAIAGLNARGPHQKVLRAAAIVLADWTVDLKAAVAGATNFADLKARVAALPQLTPANLRTAIQNKLESGNVDT